MTQNDPDRPKSVPGREANAQQLPKRFYSAVTTRAEEGGHAVLLDDRPVRTPKKKLLAVPTADLGQAIAEEWSAQADVIDPATMPLTKIANTAIDGVVGNEEAVREEIVGFAGSDLLCYRAEHPQELIERQAAAWDPVLRWAEEALAVRLDVAEGVMPVEQTSDALAAVDTLLAGLAPLALAPMHVLVTLSGSTVLALAVQQGHLSDADAWAAAHVDEDWQIEQWGEDAEAAERRARRWQEFTAAAGFLRLLG